MHQTEQPTAELIEKEDIVNLHFPHADVLTDPEARQRRRYEADRASTLGNAFHNKVSIFFQTADGAVKRVDAAAWGAHEEYLTLKAGIMLPIRAILRFEF